MKMKTSIKVRINRKAKTATLYVFDSATSKSHSVYRTGKENLEEIENMTEYDWQKYLEYSLNYRFVRNIT